MELWVSGLALKRDSNETVFRGGITHVQAAPQLLNGRSTESSGSSLTHTRFSIDIHLDPVAFLYFSRRHTRTLSYRRRTEFRH